MEESRAIRLVSIRRLEELLGEKREDIYRIAEHAGRYYEPFDRRRQIGSGKWRHIDNPSPNLKRIQRKINKRILSQLEFPDTMFGGVRGRTVLQNATAHLGQPLVVTLDLKDCFPSITDRQVFDSLRNRGGCSTDIASVLTKLTTYQKRIPQGAPTSLTLANLCLISLSTKLSEIAESFDLKISLFVDDIALSGARALDAMEDCIRAIHSFGHSVAQKKIHRMPASTRQTVTGLVVNRVISIPLEKREDIRNLILDTAHQPLIPDHILRSIAGKIRYVTSVSPHHGLVLKHLAEKYLPKKGVSVKRIPTYEQRLCNDYSRHRFTARAATSKDSSGLQELS